MSGIRLRTHHSIWILGRGSQTAVRSNIEICWNWSLDWKTQKVLAASHRGLGLKEFSNNKEGWNFDIVAIVYKIFKLGIVD